MNEGNQTSTATKKIMLEGLVETKAAAASKMTNFSAYAKDSAGNFT